jgi:rhamnose transport system permease protein
MTFLRKLDFWDMLLAGACLAVVLYAAVFVPNFLSAFNLSQLAASASEKALLIITREIDLSVASMLALTSVVFGNLPGTQIPWTIVPFLLLAPVFAVILQKMPVGKRIHAIGGNPEVARYAGINTRRMVFRLFIMSGVVAGIAGIVYTARLSNARANNALGMELDVITIVLLGGISVFGGKGRLTGVLLALVLIAAIRNVLAPNQIGGDAQGMIIGLRLIGSLLVGNYWRSAQESLNRSRSLRGTKGKVRGSSQTPEFQRRMT